MRWLAISHLDFASSCVCSPDSPDTAMVYPTNVAIILAYQKFGGVGEILTIAGSLDARHRSLRLCSIQVPDLIYLCIRCCKLIWLLHSSVCVCVGFCCSSRHWHWAAVLVIQRLLMVSVSVFVNNDIGVSIGMMLVSLWYE